MTTPRKPAVRPAVETLEAREVPTAVGVRTYDGSDNNLVQTTWGAVGTDLLRVAPAAYGDGVATPAGADRPSARAVSNAVSDTAGVDVVSSTGLSGMVYAWGQFLDHDIGLTPTAGTEAFSIPVPTGDPSFDPNATGTKTIPTTRSAFDPLTGTSAANPRQQVNTVSAWIDGSMIYGSDATRAAALRTLQGGRLKTSAGGLLPVDNAATFPGGPLAMANDAHVVPDDQLFAAGDVRANENIELTALQTLFVREHNRVAAGIAAANPRLSDEAIYQQARAVVVGEIQAITYNEWLPALLGRGAVAKYRGYDPAVNPQLANEFSTAAFRFGHSLLVDDIGFLDNNGNATRDEVALSGAFFNPSLVAENGIEPLLKYLSSDPASEFDTQVVDSVRNFLFGPPGAGGFDLAALNIQRGRDHGLADYNTARAAYGLPRVTDFAQITADRATQEKLRTLYGNVNNIDLWVGVLAESHVAGADTGPTARAIIAEQFTRLRDGDRFWYQNAFSGRQLRQIDGTTLADVVRRNTTYTNLQDNLFYFRASVGGTVYAADTRRPAAGRIVELVDADGAVVATSATTANGRYRFTQTDGLRTGDYTVRTTDAGGTVYTKAVAVTRGGVFLANADLGPAGRPPRHGPGVGFDLPGDDGFHGVGVGRPPGGHSRRP